MQHMKSLFILASLAAGTIWFSTEFPKKAFAIQNQDGFAVVELFTSEGCSSCPPADIAATELVNEYKNNVFVLGFHVDYWDHLGWKDIFSNAAYSKRQQQYGSILGLNSIYTPQVVVNGKKEFVGSDRNRLYATVEGELKGMNAARISLKATKTDNNMVAVSYTASAGSSSIVNIALIQLRGQTEVKRGENSGKRLMHINIVRDFKSVNNSKEQGNIILSIPEGLSSGDCRVIAYAQNKNDWHITTAAEAEIASPGNK